MKAVFAAMLGAVCIAERCGSHAVRVNYDKARQMCECAPLPVISMQIAAVAARKSETITRVKVLGAMRRRRVAREP